MLKHKIIALFTPLLLLTLNSCIDDTLEDTSHVISNELNTVQVLENYEQFSTYVDILKLTGHYTSFQNDGNYTCFAPTNTAIEAYIFTKWGVSSIDELTGEQKEFLETLVEFHTLSKTLSTENFDDGRLKNTLTGDYLIYSIVDNNGISNIILNGNNSLGISNIETSNGIIHEIHGMLDPYTNTIPVKMELEGKHTIFVEAMKQTGFYDTFSELTDEFGNKKSYTLFAESDEVYSNHGINSFDDLVNEISPNNDDYTNNDLSKYIAYHATLNSKNLLNLNIGKSLTTLLVNNAIIVTLNNNEIRLNEDITANEEDKSWIGLIIEDSNDVLKNGVYYTVNKLLKPSTLKPTHILFDVISDQPEYNDSTPYTYYNQAFWSGIYWSPDRPTRYIENKKNGLYLNNDILDQANLAVIEFTTPVIPIGEYELLIGGVVGNSARGVFQLYWDDQPIGIYDMRTRFSNSQLESKIYMQQIGWRIGHDFIEDSLGNKASEYSSRTRFIISDDLVCDTQSTHILRLETIISGNGPIDYIEFIPINR